MVKITMEVEMMVEESRVCKSASHILISYLRLRRIVAVNEYMNTGILIYTRHEGCLSETNGGLAILMVTLPCTHICLSITLLPLTGLLDRISGSIIEMWP
jgi:hypothetical protein